MRRRRDLTPLAVRSGTVAAMVGATLMSCAPAADLSVATPETSPVVESATQREPSPASPTPVEGLSQATAIEHLEGYGLFCDEREKRWVCRGESEDDVALYEVTVAVDEGRVVEVGAMATTAGGGPLDTRDADFLGHVARLADDEAYAWVIDSWGRVEPDPPLTTEVGGVLLELSGSEQARFLDIGLGGMP